MLFICFVFRNIIKIILLYIGKESGDAYVCQANIQIKLGEKDDAATAFLNAAKSYKKSNPIGI